MELLCIKNEAGLTGSMGMDTAVDEVVKVMKELERYAPTKDEYSQLCLLLTLPRLTDHLQYRDWNPSNARVQCFQVRQSTSCAGLEARLRSLDASV